MGFIWLTAFWLAGELLVRLLHIPLPGQIVGMALLLLALHRGWVKLAAIREAADLLLKHMMLLFVPVVVGIIVYYPALLDHPLPIAAAVLAGTLGVLAASGAAAAAVQANRSKRKERRNSHDLPL